MRMPSLPHTIISKEQSLLILRREVGVITVAEVNVPFAYMLFDILSVLWWTTRTNYEGHPQISLKTISPAAKSNATNLSSIFHLQILNLTPYLQNYTCVTNVHWNLLISTCTIGWVGYFWPLNRGHLHTHTTFFFFFFLYIQLCQFLNYRVSGMVQKKRGGGGSWP